MTARVDALIVGGGVIGLVLARRLALAGLSVGLVDDGAPNASAAAAGMLAPSFEDGAAGAGALEEFGRKSLALWRDLAPALLEETGIDTDFDDSGILFAAFDETELAGAGERLDRQQALALEPSLSPDSIGARFARSDAQVDPRLACAALKASLQSRARIFNGRLREIETRAGRIVGARLDSGAMIAADAIVLATGASCNTYGGLRKGALFPVKGEALAIAGPAAGPRRVVRSRRVYLCPKSDGRLIIGASEIAHEASLEPDAARIAELRAAADSLFPALGGAAEISRWAGLRPGTADKAPIIGPAPEGSDGLFYALGHYRNGILFAPATAELLARRLAGVQLDDEDRRAFAAFSPARFHSPAFQTLGVS